MTAEQLLVAGPREGRCELVDGVLRMMSPGGWKHGEILSRVNILVGGFIEQHRLGKSFGAETGFLLSRSPDTVRAPDFAFVAKANLPADEPKVAYWPGAPDLVVEVLSPDDRPREVDEKVARWLAAGTSQVWIIDPKSQSVSIHQKSSSPVVLGKNDTLDAGDLVVGFRAPVAEIFHPLKP